MIVLGIETSCDETAAAVCKNGKIISSVVSQQIIHRQYGGVVPELASREHEILLNRVINEAIIKANIKLENLNAVAVTQGPGLNGTLLTGICFAKGLGLGLGIPVVPINHLEGHIFANFIANPSLELPFICLLVSGGHTQLWHVKAIGEYKLLGETRDDAAGEAFDKSGKILGLEYPAGPKIDELSKDGDPYKFKFTKPNVADLDFSFSGLKTNFKNFILKNDKSFIEDNFNDICASLQMTIIDILIDKIKVASNKFQIKQVVVCGGVSANSQLRSKLKALENEQIKTYVPEIQYSTDNAAMIGISGYYKFLDSNFGHLSDQSTAKYPLS